MKCTLCVEFKKAQRVPFLINIWILTRGQNQSSNSKKDSNYWRYDDWVAKVRQKEQWSSRGKE